MFSGKLTDADFNAFCFLWKWKLGTSRMLAMGVYTHLGLGGVYSRLRHLQKRKFIDTESDTKRRLVVWVLTPRGYAVVKERLPFLREDGYRSEFLMHDYWVATVHLGEFLCSQPDGLGLFSEQQLRRYYLAEYPDWVPKSVYHRPDGYWHLPHLGGATHALEVELSRKKRSQYKSVANFYVEKKCQRVHWLVPNVTTLRCVARGLRIEDPQFAERHSFYLLDHYRQCGWNSPVAYGLDKGKTLAEGLGANVAPTECRGTSVALLDTRLKRFELAN